MERLSELIFKGDGDAAYRYLRLGGMFSKVIADLSEISSLWKAEEARRILGMGRYDPGYDGLNKEVPEAVRDHAVRMMAESIDADPELGFIWRTGISQGSTFPSTISRH